MTEQEVKDGVERVLYGWGFKVEKIPEDPVVPTPDLLAIGDFRYVIEVKTKEDDPTEVSGRQQALREGRIVEISSAFVPRNTLSKIMKDGTRQLRSFAALRDFSLLWLIARGADQTGQYEQFRSTLYGLTNVVGPDSNRFIRCYYLHDSAFYRWRADLDGAVISTLEGLGALCINSYSPRAEAFARSDFAARFGTAIVSPSSEEGRREAYIADCEIDRRDEGAVLRYLCNKYRRPN